MMDRADVRAATVVTDQQRLFFEAYGFLIWRGLFADDVTEISEAFDEVFDNPENPRLPMNFVGYRFHTRYAMGNFVEIDPRLTAVASDPRVTGIANDLLGPDASYISSDGSIYCNETEWHFDTPDRPELRHIKFTFYLEPLDDATGAPRVLPVSHHHPDLYRGPLEPYLGYDGAIEQRTGLRGEELPYWTLATTPGDLLAWDFRLMHSSYGSTAPRRQFALNFSSQPYD